MKYRALLTAIVFFCFPQLATAQVVLSFDDVPAGLLSSQYSARGATFNFPLVRDYSQTPGLPHSGSQAIELCFAIEFCKSQLDVHFTTGQRHVKLFAGFSSQLEQPSLLRMRALDQNGNVVGESTATLGPSTGPIPVQVPLEVNLPAPRIREIVVGFASADAFNNGLVFDDLEFSTAGPPPVCTAQHDPTVQVLPPGNANVQINEFILQGKVTSEAPLDLATLTVTAPGNSRTTDLLGPIVQPTDGPFGPIRVDEALFPGTNTITVTVHNCHGTGQASTTVTYEPVANGTVVKLLGMEITQATQDINNSVHLIAGKPTAVRLYFSTTGSPATISGVRAFLTGYREGTYFPLLAQSVGPAEIDASQDVGAKRLDLTKSLTFNLSPDFFEQGIIHFWLVYLHIEGPGGAILACDGCVNWQAQFQPARPLNLVVAPYHYEKSNLTADTGVSLVGTLGWVNNVFPIAGNFPSDTAGINLMLQPMQSTALDLPRDNDRFIYALQTTLNDLLSQGGIPLDTHILGVVPSGSGGYAQIPGNVAYGDSRAIESATFPVDDPESYGRIWAQEIAHNFGRIHASTSHNEMPPSDPDFPYPHGGIGEPGLALGTEGWNGTPFVLAPGTPNTGFPHAHDFMSYGGSSPDNTHSWISPYTYNGLMGSFQAQAFASAPGTPVDKLVVSGSIDRQGAVTLYPFHITRTAFTTGSGVGGDFNVTLVGAGGQTLLTYRFDGRLMADLSSLSFNEFVPWKDGTERILLRSNQTVLAERRVSAHKPWVRVTSPGKGETWGAKATVSWEAGDDDNDPLTFTVFYNTGQDARWVPIATDVSARSAPIDTALLVGSTAARIRVRATDGVNTTEAESGPFTLPENPPAVTIVGTTNGQVVPRDNAVFTGSAYDARDGLLQGGKLHWSSNRNGPLGTGRQLKVTRPLSPGSHAITLTATNNQGRSASTVVNINVHSDCRFSTLTRARC